MPPKKRKSIHSNLIIMQENGKTIEEYVREYLTLTFEEGKFHYLRMRLYL